MHKLLFCSARTTAVIAAIVIGVGSAIYFVSGHDGAIHLQWLTQFSSLVKDGDFYPRWMSESFAGFGSPAFYFYPPLPYWIASAISAIGVESSVWLYRIVTVLFWLLSGWMAYVFLKTFFGNRHSAAWGALLYCVFPYRFTDMYLRNALGEHIAFAFIPLVLLSLEYIRQGRSRWPIILTAAIGWAGILLSNIPTTVILFYSALCWSLIAKYYQIRFRRSMIAFIGGSLLGVCIAAIYVFPAMALRPAFNGNQFFLLSVGEHPMTGYAVIDAFYDQLFKTFAVSIVIIIICGIWLAFSQRKAWTSFLHTGTSQSVIIALLFVAVILQIPYVLSPVMNVFPLISYIQFTWRWDIIITVCSAVLLAPLLARRHRIRGQYLLVSIFSAWSIIACISYYRSQYIASSNHKPISMPIVEAPEYLPLAVSVPKEKEFQELQRHSRDAEVQVRSGNASIRSVTRDAEETSFEASNVTENTTLLFKRLYFPTWHLRDDRGVEYRIMPDSLGRIVATLPQGKRAYSLAIALTNEEQIGGWLSGAGLLTLLGLGITTMLLRKRAALKP